MKNKSKLMKIINWILNILIIVFLIITIYMFLWKIFGDSPTDFQVVSWVIGLFSAAVLKLFAMIYYMNREVGELKIGIKNGFNNVKEDIENINGSIKEIKELLIKKTKTK
jgi:hypothetical protein